MKLVRILSLATLFIFLLGCNKPDYKFDTTISQEVLENYLEHSATMTQYMPLISFTKTIP